MSTLSFTKIQANLGRDLSPPVDFLFQELLLYHPESECVILDQSARSAHADLGRCSTQRPYCRFSRGKGSNRFEPRKLNKTLRRRVRLICIHATSADKQLPLQRPVILCKYEQIRKNNLFSSDMSNSYNHNVRASKRKQTQTFVKTSFLTSKRTFATMISVR